MKAEPVSFWQSLQWHTPTNTGSAFAEYLTWPHRQPPFISGMSISLWLGPSIYASPARSSSRPEEGTAEAHAAGGGIHVALIGRRIIGFDLQHDKSGAVALAQHAAAFAELGVVRNRASALDAGAGGDFFEIDTEARMALLITGLAVMAVVDDKDRQVRRVQDRDRRERADIHQELAVAGRDQHALVGTREGKAQPDHAGAAHRARHRVDMRAVMGQRGDVTRRAGKPRDEQEI